MVMIKKFLSYYKPYKKLFAADMLCALTVAAIDLAFPQVLKYVTQQISANNFNNILPSLGLIAACLAAAYIVRYGCQYFITSWGHIMGAKIESDMRRQLFYHYQRLSFSYYDKNNTGEMISKLVGDLFDISELAHHGPENVVLSILKIIGSFLLLIFINIEITLILFFITLIIFVFSMRQNRKMRKIFSLNRSKIAKVNSRVQDSLLGIKVVKSFTNEELEHKKFNISNDEFFETKSLSYKAMGFYHATNSLFQGLLYIAALLVGGYFVYQGKLSAIDFALYFLYIGIFIEPLNVLINFTELFQRGFSGFRRFVEVVETAPEITDSRHAKDINNLSGDIVYSDINFSYNKDIPILKDVSLVIPQGKTTALIGPSGGGKTTICSLLPRFYDINSGHITIGNIDIKDISLKTLRQNIGIVQQDIYIFGGTIKENIAYGKAGATDEEIIQAAKNADIHDFILTLPNGYDTYAGERGTLLSGGQKQRLSIARVFLKNPNILILDEATSSLDNESEKHIQKALNKLSYNRTTLVIAHRLSTIKNADNIIVISKGRISESGTHEELMGKGGIYKKYYDMQFEGIDSADLAL
ncbi:MAG: ABC transporter ATP-binding protein [Clostridia bacterium]|nr:ABC transporter ATP-binding protein [Clostridia bacterium]